MRLNIHSSTWTAVQFIAFAFLLSFSACSGGEKPGTGQNDSENVTGPSNPSSNQAPLPCFLALSDIHLNANASVIHTSGHDIGDTDTTLWNYAKAKIHSVIDSLSPKFIIYLGDMPAHAESLNPDDNHRKDLAKVLGDLRMIATTARIPLLYAPGNNDGILGDYTYFTSPEDSTPFDLDKGHAAEWPMIGSGSGADAPKVITQNKEALRQGYYSAYPLGESAKLRAIAMNTVIFNNSSGNQYDLDTMQAFANEQIKWLKAELDASVANSESVMLLMHIPPGLDGYGTEKYHSDQYMWRDLATDSGELVLDAFVNLVRNPKYDIASIFYSHTHMDELRLIHSKDGKSVSRVAISLPGITPQHSNNPGFKTVTYDPQNGYTPVDFTTYFSPFFPEEKAASFGENDSYTFRESYGYQGNGSILEAIQSIGSPDPSIGFDSTAVFEGMRKTYLVKHNEDELSLGVKDAVMVALESPQTAN